MCMSISNSGKSEMQDWLTSHGIQYPKSALKRELLLLTTVIWHIFSVKKFSYGSKITKIKNMNNIEQ